MGGLGLFLDPAGLPRGLLESGPGLWLVALSGSGKLWFMTLFGTTGGRVRSTPPAILFFGVFGQHPRFSVRVWIGEYV